MKQKLQLELIKKLLKKEGEEGFSLIELVVVVAVLAVLSAIALPSFNCFPKRAKATAALAALRQINTECAYKAADKEPEIFTSSPLDGYTIQTSGSNSCAGSNGVISVVPDNTNELPTFNLAAASGSLTYAFRGKTGTNFTECLGLICGDGGSSNIASLNSGPSKNTNQTLAVRSVKQKGPKGPVAFKELNISNDIHFPMDVDLADVDGDGDLDIIVAAYGARGSTPKDGKIAWYENTGGENPSYEERMITTEAMGASSVYAADMDGDGDLDLVSAEHDWTNNKIVWYENDGSANPSFTATDIAAGSGLNGAYDVHVADMDGDGDLDVVGAHRVDGTVAWHENKGGNTSSWESHKLPGYRNSVRDVHVADIDGDGDQDIVSASEEDDTIAFYTNNGGVFTPQVVSNKIEDATGVTVGDIDGDGDLDILSSSTEGHGKVSWHINSGGENPSWKEVVIAESDGDDVKAVDMDGDGDLDVVTGSWGEDKITWYENSGSNNPDWRSVELVTDVSAFDVDAADMDGDGDIDIVSVDILENKIFVLDNEQYK